MKNYLVVFDDGHDYHELEIESRYEMTREEIEEEAKHTVKRKYGRIARNWKLKDVYNWDYDDDPESEVENNESA